MEQHFREDCPSLEVGKQETGSGDREVRLVQRREDRRAAWVFVYGKREMC